jgi:ribosomal protein S12 methylthiotransferase
MIPDIRGPFRSRPMRDIIAESTDLASIGVKELILVAQDTTLYGTDFQNSRPGVHHQDTKTQSRIPVGFHGEPQLARLLKELGKVDGIRWLRLMYTHPAHLTEDVIDQFASNPKLCRYVDLPIQHVADHLLAKMNRGYTRKDVELLLDNLRAIPDMHVRTTIIVGLPGETEHDFAELLAFVRAARFDRLSCYAYSPEPGTKAARLPGQVSPAVKKERVRRLMLAQAAISRANLRKLVGRRLTVLVDALTDNRQGSDSESVTANCKLGTGHSRAARARTQWDAPEIDGVVRLTGRKVRPGRFVQALVTGSSTHDLTAQPL